MILLHVEAISKAVRGTSIAVRDVLQLAQERQGGMQGVHANVKVRGLRILRWQAVQLWAQHLVQTGFLPNAPDLVGQGIIT